MSSRDRYGRLAGQTRPVVGVAAVLVLGAMLMVILVLMFVFLRERGETGGAVREALVRAEFLADEGDAARRLAYAREQFRGGDVVDAIEILAPLEAAGDAAAAELRRDIEFAAFNFFRGAHWREPGALWRRTLAARLEPAIAGLATLRPEDVAIAEALELHPLLALRAETAGDWRAAVRHHQRAGNLDAATDAWARVFETQEDGAAPDPDMLADAVDTALGAGRVDEALNWLSRFRDALPMARERLFEIARQTARHEFLTPDNRLLPQDFPDRDAWHSASVRAQTARLDHEGAIDLVDRMVAEQPQAVPPRLLRWQTLRFAGRPHRALTEDALWLVRNDDVDGEVFAQSVADASALYEYELADTLFRVHRQRQSLDDAELDAWFAVQEISGTWDQAAQDIDALLARYPTRRHLHDWKARFADLLNDRTTLREHWPGFARHGTPTLETLIAFSRAFWLRDDNETALAVLDRAGPDVRRAPQYWEVRAEVARRAGDRPAYHESVDALVALGVADQWQQLDYAERRIDDPAERIDWYWRLHDETGLPLVLLRIADEAVRIGAEADLARVRDALPRLASPADRAELRFLLGLYAVRNGDVEGAFADFRAGLADVPNHPGITQSRAWLSLEEGRAEGLDAAWHLGRTRWRDEEWALLLSAIAGRRGHVRQARFLAEYLHERRPDDLAIGFNLYLSLLDAGVDAAARALATDLLARLDARPGRMHPTDAVGAAGAVPAYVRSGLVAALRGDRVHHERLDAALFASGSEDAFELGLASLLRLDRDEAARALYARWTRQRGDVPGWLDLQLALRANDLQRVAMLVDGPGAERLPPADVVTGLQRLGQPARALAFAQARLGRPGDRDDLTSQLRRQAAAVREDAHDLVHLGFRDLGEGYRRTELSTRFVQADGLWQLAARQDDLQLLDTAGDDLAVTANTLAASFRRHHREGVWELGVDIDTGGPDRAGILLEADFRLDRTLSWGLRADVASMAQLDNQWRALGQRDALGLDLTARPLRRLEVTTSLTRERYRPRDGGGSADASALNIAMEYNLTRTNPRASLFADHARRAFDDATPLTAAAGGRDVPLATRNFAFSRVGVRLAEGQLEDAAIRNRSLNWLAEIAASCDHEASRCGIDFAAGVASRVLGRDRLSITATRTTAQPLEGRASDGVSFRIDYARHF